MSDELVLTSKITAALTKAKATVASVLKVAKGDASLVELPQAPLPQDPALNEAARESVDLARDLLDRLSVPDRRRVLSEDELERLTRTYDAVQTALAGLNRSRDQIKAAAFNHFDAVARDEGKVTADTAFTKEGWAVTVDTESAIVPGLDVKLTREVSGGKVELTLDGLRALVEDEVLGQADLLDMTRQIRVVDEARALNWIRKNPERAALLVEASKVGSSTASFHLRKND